MIQSHSQKWLQDPVSHINSGTSSIRYLLDSPGIRTYCSSGCSSRRSKRKKAYKVHAAVDTLGHLLALRVGSAGEQDRARVGELAEATRSAPRRRVTFSFALPSCLWYPAPGGCAPLGLRRRGERKNLRSRPSTGGRIFSGTWPTRIPVQVQLRPYPEVIPAPARGRPVLVLAVKDAAEALGGVEEHDGAVGHIMSISGSGSPVSTSCFHASCARHFLCRYVTSGRVLGGHGPNLPASRRPNAGQARLLRLRAHGSDPCYSGRGRRALLPGLEHEGVRATASRLVGRPLG